VVFIRQALPFEFELLEPSPYSPPVRLLKSENVEYNVPLMDTIATLTRIDKHNDVLKSFTWKLSKPVAQIPGQYAILSFRDILDFGYQHMNRALPVTVNDDRIRSWTISSAPDNPTSDVITLTIKKKEKGTMSTLLHGLSETDIGKFAVPLLGVQGSFSCFIPGSRSKMLFLACGVGITPFMSMIEGLLKSKQKADVILILQSRLTYDALKPTLDGYIARATDLKLTIKPATFQNNQLIDPARIHISKEDILDTAPDVTERDVYVCGPEPWMEEIKKDLHGMGVATTNIKTELYNF